MSGSDQLSVCGSAHIQDGRARIMTFLSLVVLSDMTKQAKFLVAVLLIANALFARAGSRAFGRTSGAYE
jgi:hypothetical protein